MARLGALGRAATELGDEFIPQLGRVARIEPGFGIANLTGLVALAWALVLTATSSDMAMPMNKPMDMPMMHAMMPDLDARMMALEAKSGGDFDIEFMSAMTDHHAMALMMAAPVLIHGHHADLYTLAENIVISQGQEIKQMDQWLDAWYGVKRAV